MSNGRSRRGFEPLGALAAERMGLPRTKARELRLAQAWTAVAGEALARRARAQVRRGVLEVAVEEPAWRAAIEPLLPQLAARLFVACPELGVRQYRLRGPVQQRLDPPVPVPDLESPKPATAVRPRSTRGAAAFDDPDPERLRERLEALRERYLERADP